MLSTLRRTAWVSLTALSVSVLSGCGGTSSTNESPSTTEPGDQADRQPGDGSESPVAADQYLLAGSSVDGSSNDSTAIGNGGPDKIERLSTSPAGGDAAMRPLSPATPLSPPSLATGSRLELRPGWNASELATFLADADREMRSLINGQSGLTDPQAIQTEVQRVVALKRVAAERLIEHPGATEVDRVIGQRGYLQALSHLASMGDWKAAEQLQSVAEQSRNSADADLRSDSQLVLIGFAIESLRHGKPAAAEQVSKLVRELLDGDAANGLARGDGSVDVATLMVLGQAKDTLLQYEHTDKAMEVRDLILERFGTAKDAEVARMAAMIAASGFSQTGSAIERLDQLRQRFVPIASSGSDSVEPVTLAAWQAAVADVLSSPADVLTVEFLAGVSLEAEAVRRPDIAQATYEILQSEFAHRSDALGRVARSALQAKESRRTVIGRQFEPDLPSVDGRPLSLEDYRGKLVLMPFWSSAFPDSLMVVPNLQAIQARYPDQVAIVGINVDVAGTDVEGFVQREQLGFPSFRSESQPGAEIVNEVAYRFGAVTLLFVAIIDHEGRVAHLDFSGEDLLEEVEKRLPAN